MNTKKVAIVIVLLLVIAFLAWLVWLETKALVITLALLAVSIAALYFVVRKL